MSTGVPPIDPEVCAGNAAAYVLGALSDEEYKAFQRDMESCAVCRDAVASLQAAADALASGVPQLAAPAELRAQIVSSAYQDARRRGSSEAVHAPRRPALGRVRWRGALGIAALAAAVIALLVIALTSGSSSPARVIRAEVLARGASASLRVSGGHAELDITGMPQSAPGRVYQVWVKRSGAPQPTDALFTVTAGGSATVAVPGDVRGVKEILVTSEPRGGSLAPTRTPVIVAPI